MPEIPLALESYISPSKPVSQQRVLNMYAEIQPESANAKARAILYGCPGVVQFGSVGAGPVRGLHVMNDILYAVSGSSLYEIASDGTGTFLGGGFQPGTRPIVMADNGTQLIAVDGTNGFTYNNSTLAFSQISDVDFYAANTVSFNDSYFMLDRKDTNQFFSSDSNDGTVYPALFFASAETQSDKVLAPINHLQQLLVGGSKTIEIWYLAGGSNFPWARYQGAAVQIGLAGPYAWAKNKEDLFFLGSDKCFYRLEGPRPVRVSKHSQEWAFSQYGDVSDAIVFSLTYEGHVWVFVTFPAALKTWVYDATADLWHERDSWDANGASLGRWRGNCYAYCYGKHLIGDSESGVIGYLDRNTYTEFGNTIRGLVTTPPLHSGDSSRVYHQRFEIDIQGGVGLTTGQGENPLVQLRISDDGGHTYESLPYQSLGRIGAYNQRLCWRGLGSFYQRMMEVQVTDPVPRSFLGAYYDLEADN